MYVDNGTFWVIAIALGVAIGVVYYRLNEKAERNKQDIQLIIKTVQNMAEAIDQEFANVRNENLRKSAEIYSNVADAFDELGKGLHGAKKKEQNKRK